MSALTGKALLEAINDACKHVKHRLWIASPYIGSWKSVRSILGRSWWDSHALDFRILTDEDESPNGDTLRRFRQKGEIYHLRGLHAKLYVIDDSVLVTSANLTGAAFSRRYEAGILLTGSAAKSTIDIFEGWLNLEACRPFDLATLNKLVKANRGEAGEGLKDALPQLGALPRDPGDFGGHEHDELFSDYERFRAAYRDLAREYASVQRIWPAAPLYFEVDGFLSFLFGYHDGKVSKPFANRSQLPRRLSQRDLGNEIRLYAKQFKDWATRSEEQDDGEWRSRHSQLVRRLLSRDRIGKLGKEEIQQVVNGLNCMNDTRQLNRFLKDPPNNAETVRRAWTNLLYGRGPLPERTSLCAEQLYSFKRSSIQELLGFYDPKEYPLRNKRVNAGLRFFGFDVSAD